MASLAARTHHSDPHPHVVRTEGVCGGAPRLRDTRIAVRAIAELFRSGEPAQEIEALYPHVDPATIQDGIGYYLDHRQEIEANSLKTVLAQTDAVLGEDGVVRFADRHR
jgi:uncharacterized protein (DUF433 family)